MTGLIKTTTYSLKTLATLAQEPRTRTLASHVGRFIWHFVEMTLAMGAGMALFPMLVGLILASSGYTAALERGTYLRAIASSIFMTIPMVAWMIFRGHGWRHSLEMSVAMLAPVAAIIVLRLLEVENYLPWLTKVNCVAMTLGMLAAMLYRRDHYMGNHAGHGHKANTASPQGENACH